LGKLFEEKSEIFLFYKVLKPMHILKNFKFCYFDFDLLPQTILPSFLGLCIFFTGCNSGWSNRWAGRWACGYSQFKTRGIVTIRSIIY
jgi:hypothetical protein